MKNTVKTIRNVLIAFSAMALFVLASCDIGLGEALDLVGPTVIITKPAARENVKGSFDIEGVVTDDFAVAKVVVTLTGNNETDEWVHDESGWKYKANGATDYEDYTKATWKVSNGGRRVEWTIQDAQLNSGKKTIDVRATDNEGNVSAESHKARDVEVDGEGPEVSIGSPVAYDSPDVFNESTWKSITKVSLFLTENFKISGKAVDQNNVKYVDLKVYKDSTLAYSKRYVTEADNADGETNYEEIESVRSWESSELDLSTDLGINTNEKQVLKIVTKAMDMAGNPGNEQTKYICVWKAAAQPWIELQSLKDTTATNTLKAYADSTVLGTAYDDSAIKEVKVTLRNGSSTGAFVTGYPKTISGGGESNAFFEIKVPKDSGVYYVTIEASDASGNNADNVKGFIEVVDKNFPSIEIKHTVGGVEKNVSDKLFGDASGNFSFKITAKDDTKVKTIKMAYITKPEDVIKYADNKYSGWNTTSSNLSDLRTSVYVVPTANITDKGIGTDGRIVYEATIGPINIFTHLGIDGTDGKQLGNQTFVFYVEDDSKENGTPKPNSITKDYTIVGDTGIPTVKFTKLEYLANGTTVSETFTNTEKLLPMFGTDTKVRVHGEISDDSADVWGTDKIKDKFSLTLKGGTTSSISWGTETTVSGKKVRPFSAEYGNLTELSSLIFTGTLTDYAGNKATEKYTYIVDRQTAQVDYISSSTSDGYYREAGTKINVTIRFNRPLKFTKGTTAMPVLTLSNNATATMTEPANTMPTSAELLREFKFTYTVGTDASEEETNLNVKSCNWNGAKLFDSNNNEVTDKIVTSLKAAFASGSKKNLADMKSINIVMSIPALQTATLDETTGDLVLTYNKAVAKGKGSLTLTQQKTSGGDGVDKVPTVLTPERYRKLSTTFTQFYKETTNGATESSEAYSSSSVKIFTPDSTPKYVLDYDKDPSSLISAYEGTKAHIITQGIKSNKVTFSNENQTVTINLGANPLPCKGATYKLVIPEGFVVDARNDSFKVAASNDKTFTAAGIEEPVIRIKKSKAGYNNGVASQPTTSYFRIDCETPSVTLSYSYTPITVAESDLDGDKDINDYITPGSKTVGTEVTGNYRAPVTIGSNSYKQGKIYQITATATKGGSTATTRNVAYRTTIAVENVNGKITDDVKKKLGNNVSIWLRGGDKTSGPNTTPGFPLSWAAEDFNGIALLTKDGNDWYYVSWEINATCYCGIIAGSIDSNSGTKGPAKFISGQNLWVTKKAYYGIEPGGYLGMNTSGSKGGGFSFNVGDDGKVQDRPSN